MSDRPRLKVVLCWHMHQPQYRDLRTGVYTLPWTYLHAIKDYTDIAAILEACPGARTVVNFTPTVLEQIADYNGQISRFLAHGHAVSDPLLAALAATPGTLDAEQYPALVRACLRVNEERLINRFAPFRRLADLATRFREQPDILPYVSEQFLADILVWYHLAWMGETVRLRDARIQRLILKGHTYTSEDRRELVTVIGELVGAVIPRYRALAEAGQVELSMTPYAHPILPLLISLDSAREAMPDVTLPQLKEYRAAAERRRGSTDRRGSGRCPLPPCYPGGSERVEWHIRHGREVFEHHFGFRAAGCWPSEGGVSADTLRLLGKSGFAWAATGEKVLRNSLERSGQMEKLGHTPWLYQPYGVDGSDIACFFRDDGLSDLIGFTYSKWHSDDAVNNLVHHLENIAMASRHEPNRVVSIILDGENAWEYYPDNAYHFLTALYQRLSTHEKLELTTFSQWLSTAPATPAVKLPTMVAGSWVYGTFSTWVGDRAKNRGWDMLCDAKRAFDSVVATGALQGDALLAAERQLAICEGSDWFWWFGDYNPAETVSDFEKLYRLHLTNLYALLNVLPHDYLREAVSTGNSTASAHSGTMLPQQKPG